MISIIYLVVAIVCAILLIIMAALGGFGGDASVGGHDIDVGGHGIDLNGHGDYSGSSLSPLSIPVLLTFGATFGAVGAILEQLKYDELLTPVIAVIMGILVAGGMYALVYYMIFKSQASTQTNLGEMVGLDGLVTVAIKDKEPGQVVVNTEKRGRIPVAATAKEEIAANTPVKVIGIAGDALIVERAKEG
jgi:membrane-bound ClpP family serine protease